MAFRKASSSLRYGLVKAVMKSLTPLWFHDAKQLNVNHVPRPFTLFLKNHFGNKLLRGCEIGFGTGENANSLLKELNVEALYCVDPLTSYVGELGLVCYSERGTSLLNKLIMDSRVHFLKVTSDYAFNSSVIPKDLDFIYVDGLHTTKQCCSDILNGLSHVKLGCFVGGHDFSIQFQSMVVPAVFQVSKLTRLIPTVEIPDFWFKKEVAEK